MKIVYIEDNLLNFRLVQRMLNSHEILGSMTGSKGIKLVWQEKPDLILLDINLPDMDGYRVLDMLRANPFCKDIPIIAVTANAMHGDREHIMSFGFNGYVAKPLSRLELQNAIRMATVKV